jgi:hypothetical protein
MEEWKTINFRGRVFTVSNYGNIKTKDGTRNRRMGTSSSGYSCVTDSKCYLIHRVVASAFIENPLNKPCVNHINGNKKDNRVENLEWMTKSENMMHSVNVLGNKTNIQGFRDNWLNPMHCVPILMYNKEMIFIKEFKSLTECSKYLGVGVTAVSNSLNKRSSTVKNHIVKYKNR